MKNRKLLIPSALCLFALAGTITGCNKGKDVDPGCYIGVYGGDDLDYTIKCDGKENNLTFGKDVEITFTPKIVNAEGSEARKLGLPESYISLDPIHEEEKAAAPYVGYGNKIYHPYDYRLTKDLSYKWEKVTDTKGYKLTIPAANFKKNVIISFNSDLWSVEKLLDDVKGTNNCGITYPYFLGDNEPSKDTKTKGYDTFNGVNSYVLEDFIKSEQLYEIMPSGISPIEDRGKVYNLSRNNDLDSKNLNNDGIIIGFEMESHALNTLDGVTNSNFELYVTNGQAETEKGTKIDVSTSMVLDAASGFVKATIPWSVLYKNENNTIVRKYGDAETKYLYFKKARCNVLSTFTAEDNSDYVSKPLMGLEDVTGKVFGVPAFYKDNLATNAPYGLCFSEGGLGKYINTESKTYELKSWPNISLKFNKQDGTASTTKTLSTDPVTVKKVISIAGSELGPCKFDYKEIGDGWALTYVRMFTDTTYETLLTPIGIFLMPQSKLSFYYPGTTEYAKSVEVVYTAPSI